MDEKISSLKQHIIGGDVIPTLENFGLVWFDQVGRGIGSGILVTNEWFLTAAHVLAGNENCPTDLPNVGNVKARCGVTPGCTVVHLGTGMRGQSEIPIDPRASATSVVESRESEIGRVTALARTRG